MTEHRRRLPYGSWPSPITAARLVQGAAAVGEARVDGADVWWSEQRPEEGGRTQLVRFSAGNHDHDLFGPWDPATPEGSWNARTAVLEYGGGAWGVRKGVVVFANWADQRLYRVDPGLEARPVPLTPEPAVPRGLRWSVPVWLDDDWLVCVRESHEPHAVAAHGEAVDELVALPLDGSAVADPSRVRVLVTGPDFVHTPAVSGDRLAWLQWDHPNMPWDGTELAVATIRRGADGAPEGLDESCVVAGGPAESVVQPGFLADGSLAFCTDRTGWWGPWRLPADGGAAVPMLHSGVDGEIGGPLWVGGLRWWTELGPGYLLVTVRADGVDRLALITPDGVLDELDTPFTEIGQLAAVGDGTSAAVVAAGAIEEPAPYLLEVLAEGGPEPIVVLERLREPRDDGVDPAWFSRPTHVSFRSAEGRTAHALHYPPHHPEVAGPAGEHPPLIVVIHGGPTSAARVRLDLAKQFWTSRGFAVLDVDHGGSTGYGRPFRDLLRGRWGEVDVADAVAAARHLADIGEADPHRMAIRGGSAGGFTTLAALCFHDAFAAGASHYGVADLAALAAETHKFESRYLDSLVGPWPEARETYEARSPIHHTDGLSVPLLVLQGSEDEVVPPDQAEMIVAALAAKGIPHAYLLFEGEQHGFRRADTIVRALEAELWFYGRVFGFTPADRLEPVPGAVGL